MMEAPCSKKQVMTWMRILLMAIVFFHPPFTKSNKLDHPFLCFYEGLGSTVNLRLRDSDSNLTHAFETLPEQVFEWNLAVKVKITTTRPTVIWSMESWADLQVQDSVVNGMRLTSCLSFAPHFCVESDKLWVLDFEWHSFELTISVKVKSSKDGIDNSRTICMSLKQDGNAFKTQMCQTFYALHRFQWPSSNITLGSYRFGGCIASVNYTIQHIDQSSSVPSMLSESLWGEANVASWKHTLLNIDNTRGEESRIGASASGMVFLGDGAQFLSPLTPTHDLTIVDGTISHFHSEIMEKKMALQTESGAGLCKPTFTVIFYSASSFWDQYIFLYSDWIELVVLSQLSQHFDIKLVVRRCFPCLAKDLLLTENSLVALNAHSQPQIDIKEYGRLLQVSGKNNVGLFHLNHERPWVDSGATDRDSYLYSLSEAYQIGWAYVLRNYHYPPLTDGLSFYIPLGPKKYRLYDSSSNNDDVNWQEMLKASERPTFCFFAGSPLGHQRLEMINQLKDICELVTDGSVQGPHYAQRMRESVFVLCPGGNNIETFRLWESLESGAIPILINSSENFLQQQKEVSGINHNTTGAIPSSSMEYLHLQLPKEILESPILFFTTWSEVQSYFRGLMSETREKQTELINAIQAHVVNDWYQKSFRPGVPEIIMAAQQQ